MPVLQFPHLSPWWHLPAAEQHCYVHLYRCHVVDNLIASSLFHLLYTWVLVCSTEPAAETIHLSCICQVCLTHILNSQLLSQLNKGRTLDLAKYVVQLIHLTCFISKVFKATSVLISYDLLVPAASFSVSIHLDILNTFCNCDPCMISKWGLFTLSEVVNGHVLKIFLG